MLRTAFLGFLFGLLTLGASAAGSPFFVSPDGDDQHPGTREQPFRTLERARDQVRALRAEGQLPEEAN